MTLPASIRTSTLLTFPSRVIGSGPIAVSKINGIWQIILSFASLAPQFPVGAQLDTDQILIWDSIAKTFFTVPMSYFATGGSAAAAQQRSVMSAADLPLDQAGSAKDQFVNCNCSAPLTIPLPGYLSRVGLQLVIKDVGMQATANPITIAAAAGETIDGFASVLLDTNGMEVALLPFNDGINTGWAVI